MDGRQFCATAAKPGPLVLVAELDGEVVGSGLGGRSDDPERGFSRRLACCPHARRRGVGTALLAPARRPMRLGWTRRVSTSRSTTGIAGVRRALRVRRDRSPGRAGAALWRRAEIASTRARRDRGRDDRRAPGLLREAYPLARRGLQPTWRWSGSSRSRSRTGSDEEATLPEGSFVALADGEIVGYSGLCQHDNDGVAEDGLTVVRRDWRRRGLATALKRARARVGCRTRASRGRDLDAAAETTACAAVNERLGYEYRDVSVTMVAPLPLAGAWMTVADERKRTVEAGYDALADRFGEWMARVEGDPWERLRGRAGRPASGRRSRARSRLSGTAPRSPASPTGSTWSEWTFSERQLQLARAAVPEATFHQADFTRAAPAPPRRSTRSTALYSIVHVPRGRAPALFSESSAG